MVLEHEMRRISSIVKDQIWIPAGARRESNIISFFELTKFTSQRIFRCTTRNPARLLLSTRKLESHFQPKQRRLRFAWRKCYRRTNGPLLRAWQVFLSERPPEKHILKIYLRNKSLFQEVIWGHLGTSEVIRGPLGSSGVMLGQFFKIFPRNFDFEWDLKYFFSHLIWNESF